VTYRRLPDDLPDRLKKAGLKVVVIDGWRLRGRPVSTGEFKPVGVLNHHTGSHDPIGDFADDLTYAKWLFLTGRSDLPAPLCQLSISAEGTVYVGASGRANHAGTARPSGSVAGGDGNALYVGIEWMLSGTQAIPAGMYAAAVKTNAVLLDIFKSSEQAASCHYQTSTTGKWDIGDPDGIPFKGHKVLNVSKFRGAIKEYRTAQKPIKPDADLVLVKAMHASLQFSDTPKQQEEDIRDLFERAKTRDVWWVTGTEAGPGAEPTGELLLRLGKAAGYQVWVPSEHKGVGNATDSWVAVDSERVKKGSWKTGFEPGIPGSKALYTAQGLPGDALPRWGPKGVVWVSFENVDIGVVGVAAAHYLTKGRSPKGQPIKGVDHYEWNKTLAAEIGDWAREHGKGKGLAFYGGDQNIVDRTDDTFFGQPLTSAWDELKKWENTGHGNIDVIASYDGDSRVSAQAVRALDDKEFFQHGDHFVVEAEFKVARLG
jgi:hypothetical protein